MKTLKLKKAEPTLAQKPVAPAEGGAPAPAAEAAAPAAAAPSAAPFVSSRHANPLEAGAAAPVKKDNWIYAGVLAILTTLILIALICYQYFVDFKALEIA